MTLSLHGIGVSRGYAIGRVKVLRRGQPEVLEYAIPDAYVEEEIARFRSAVDEATAQLQSIRDRIPGKVSADTVSFIDTHLLMLQDSTLTVEPQSLIQSRHCNAEWALKTQRDRLVRVFDQMEDSYLRTRRDDVDHVVNRLLRILLDDEDEKGPDHSETRLQGRIVVADDLTPADTVLMQHQGIVAFVTEFGGPLSHTAILARNLGIPAVIGVRSARRYLREGEDIIVDGEQGVVLSATDPIVLEHYRKRQRSQQQDRARLVGLRDRPASTRDGVPVSLQANIELPEDVTLGMEGGAAGVGLYRTEFLFMNRPDSPSEEEHFESYDGVIRALKGRPLTIRTLDLGSDKQVDGGRSNGPVATNPALGLRAIRLCLQDPGLFLPQLRAILRASALGPVRMMIPMLSSLQELHKVRQLVTDTMRDLTRAGIAFDPALPLGGMVEVPAAAIVASMFSRYLEFLSIGTNDLIQYTLAIDRIDDEVNYLYDPLHPAVLRLIHNTIEAGLQRGIPVSMCGEMAGDRRYTRLLLGMGLREFSMHPSAILEIKQIVMHSDVNELRAQAAELMRCDDPEQLPELLARLA
jgi:phosphotransferase system enzyme I (PtsI)